MPENEPPNESSYTGPAHDEIRRIIRDALSEHKVDRRLHLIDDRCKKVVSLLFQKLKSVP